ncbi:MAG: Protein-methionine-sulfoxide reductase heme-binding subunit MsrQ, partial [Anaerolineales bacterium]|nr:Protein-methionine-sulfoxide reductase heme-binding subunit MsrQ [Anaerolineales bacterium]
IREPLAYGTVVILLLVLRIPVVRRVVNFKRWMSPFTPGGAQRMGSRERADHSRDLPAPETGVPK